MTVGAIFDVIMTVVNGSRVSGVVTEKSVPVNIDTAVGHKVGGSIVESGNVAEVLKFPKSPGTVTVLVTVVVLGNIEKKTPETWGGSTQSEVVVGELEIVEV